MSNRRLTQRQRARIQRQQDHRRERADGSTPAMDEIGLGPERTGLVIANFGAALIVEDDEGDLYRGATKSGPAGLRRPGGLAAVRRGRKVGWWWR